MKLFEEINKDEPTSDKKTKAKNSGPYLTFSTKCEMENINKINKIYSTILIKNKYWLKLKLPLNIEPPLAIIGLL